MKSEEMKSSFAEKLRDKRTGAGAIIGSSSYNEDVRNLVVNYCGNTQIGLSLHDLSQHGRGDMQSTASDHHYLAQLLTHYTIDNPTKLNKNECKDLEEKTRKQSLCTAWREARQLRLTASNFGKICKAPQMKH